LNKNDDLNSKNNIHEDVTLCRGEFGDVKNYIQNKNTFSFHENFSLLVSEVNFSDFVKNLDFSKFFPIKAFLEKF